MSTFRIQAQLSTAIRSLAYLRAELDAEHTPRFVKLVLRCQQSYTTLRIRHLIQQLHANPSTAAAPPYRK